MSRRLPDCEARYQKAIKQGNLIPIYDLPAIREYKFFKIVENEFCHCRQADVNHMLVVKREVRFKDLAPYELEEYVKIRIDLDGDYDCLMSNFKPMRSVDNIFHEHLYKLTEDLK